MKLFPAIVLDGNQRAALATVRSLGQRKVPVFVAEMAPAPLAASSKYCASTLQYPDPAADPRAFTQWLRETAQRHPGAVLLPMTDLTVPLVLKAAPEISQLRTALPSLELYERVSDKYRLFELAKQIGVRVPRTLLLSKANLQNLAECDFSYPVVVKPRQSAMRLATGFRKRTVRYAADKAHLERIVREELADDTDELLLQEYVKGVGAGLFAIYDRGRPLFFFAHRRIREKPPSGGVSVMCESVPPPEATLAAARKLLTTVGWHGVAMVEFKIDEAGEPWLIEINARFWGSLQLAVDAGADFPWFLYRIAAGLPQDLPRGYRADIRLRWWLGDLDNLYARLRSREWTPTLGSKAKAIGEFLAPWQPGLKYEFLRMNDPKPAARAFKQYLAALTGKKSG